MAKRAALPQDTVENRVYLFQSLAGAFVAAAAEQLASPDPEVHARALRALADLAYVSCVVADTGGEPAERVRARVLEGREPGAGTRARPPR